jgi:hypothetical protein
MDTNKWFPKHREGRKNGFVLNELLYREEEGWPGISAYEDLGKIKHEKR